MRSAARWTEHRVIAPQSPVSAIEPGSEPHWFEDNSSVAETAVTVSVLSPGDRVVLSYIDKADSRPIFYLITSEPSDSKAGLLCNLSPLAKQLSEIDVGDEFNFRAGSSDQRILYVAKQSAGN